MSDLVWVRSSTRPTSTLHISALHDGRLDRYGNAVGVVCGSVVEHAAALCEPIDYPTLMASSRSLVKTGTCRGCFDMAASLLAPAVAS